MTTTIIPKSIAYTSVAVLTNGQTDFNFNFLATDVADLKASYYAPSADEVTQTFVGGIDFTADGIDNPKGGAIHIVAGVTLKVGGTLVIYRDIAIERENDYQRDLHADDLNREQGEIFQILQQLKRDVDASYRAAPGEVLPPVNDLVALMQQAIAAAGNVIFFDSWEQVKADVTAWAVGTRLQTKEGMAWDVVSTGQDFSRPDGLKLRWVEGRPLVVYAWGQSNMRGIGDQATTPPRPNRMVYAWNSQTSPIANGTAWQVAQFNQNPFSGGNANQLAWWFCDELQRRIGRRVYLFVAAAGGHHIEAFMNSVDLANNGWAATPGEGDLFTHATAQFDAGLPLIPGSPTKIDYVIGHQGEANMQEQVEVYAKKLRIMLKRHEFRGDISIPSCNIIVGELCDGANNGRYKDRHASALRRLQLGTYDDAFPLLKVVHTHGLQPVSQIDETHFHPDAITALGKRYADAAFTHQEIPELDPTLIDLSVDGGLAWSTGSVAGQNQISYYRRGPFTLDATQYTIADDPTIGWSYVAPGSTRTVTVGRKMFRVPRQRGFCIEMELANAHPSAIATLRLGVYEYDDDKVYQAVNDAADVVVAAGTTQRVFKTFANATSSLTPDKTFGANARWFAPKIEFNPAGTGAAMRFNILGMRWF